MADALANTGFHETDILKRRGRAVPAWPAFTVPWTQELCDTWSVGTS